MGNNQGIGHLQSAKAHVTRGQQIIGTNVPINTTTVGKAQATPVKSSKTDPKITNPTSIGTKWSHDDNSIKYNREWDRQNGNWDTSKISLDEKYTDRYGDMKHVEEYSTDINRNGFKFEDKHDLSGDGFRVQTEDSLEYINDTGKVEKEDTFKMPDNMTVGVDIASTDIEALNHEGSVWGDEWGDENNKLKVDALGYETSGSAAAKMENGTFSAEATINAEAYLAKASYEGTYGPANVSAEASVGANASGNAGVEFNPLKGDANVGVGAEAFVGGKAELEAGVGNDYAGVKGNAGVSYGIGAEFNADVGIDDWKMNAEFDVGATLGLGVDLGFEIELDAKKLTGWIPKTPW